MVEKGKEDIEENIELVKCFIYDSNGYVVICPRSDRFEQIVMSRDKFQFYLDSKFIIPWK